MSTRQLIKENAKQAVKLPDWISQKAPDGENPAPTIAPSSLPGDKVVLGGDGSDQETALRKGRQVHLLLEHLPKTDVENWQTKAEQLLVGDCLPVDSAEFTAVLNETKAVIENPALAFVLVAKLLPPCV